MTKPEFDDLREHVSGLEDISAEDAYRIMEADTQQYMAEHFDMNGDPYEDFMGNPW